MALRRRHPRLPRYKALAKRTRREKAYERALKKYKSDPRKKVRLRDDYNERGERVRPFFAIEGVPTPKRPGLWPVRNMPGLFWSGADGQVINIRDFTESSRYDTIELFQSIESEEDLDDEYDED